MAGQVCGSGRPHPRSGLTRPGWSEVFPQKKIGCWVWKTFVSELDMTIELDMTMLCC